MKKYFSLNSILIALISLMLTGCEGKFIPDPIDPRLPKYTQSGNEVAGALINQDIWKSIVTYGFSSSSNVPSLKVYQLNDSIVFRMQGELIKPNNPSEFADLRFHLEDLNIHTFSDLKLLTNQKIPLDGVKNYGSFIRYSNSPSLPECTGRAGVGQIYFRNVALNEAQGTAILSGTFGFKAMSSDCGTIEVSYGRFDFGFNTNSNLQLN